MFITIAVHHPRPEHRDDFLAFMARVVERTREAPDALLTLEEAQPG